jgi:transcription initiation factor IIE alpha subunit
MIAQDTGEIMSRVGGTVMETLWDWLLQRGPATADDVAGSLRLSRTESYQVVRQAAERGLIRVVAHVHTDDNHRTLAWDIDSPDRELVWLRNEQRVRGRYCTCQRAGPTRGRVGAA